MPCGYDNWCYSQDISLWLDELLQMLFPFRLPALSFCCYVYTVLKFVDGDQLKMDTLRRCRETSSAVLLTQPKINTSSPGLCLFSLGYACPHTLPPPPVTVNPTTLSKMLNVHCLLHDYMGPWAPLETSHKEVEDSQKSCLQT
jgi:hypothetical protein